MAAGLVVLLGLLVVAGAQDPYDDLPEGHRRGVDLALEQLKSHASVTHHFRFLRTLEKAEIDSGFGVKYLFQHFHLKPTRCTKGTTNSSAQTCPFRNDRPMMDCAVCYKTSMDQIEPTPKPYVHCVQKPRVTPQILTSRADHCRKMAYSSGAPTLLAVGSG